MRIAPYWQRATHDGVGHDGKPIVVETFGWSFDSSEHAAAHAKERAARAFERFRAKRLGTQPAGEFEYYPNHPIREEVIERHDLGGPGPTLITRNRYGAEILNSPGVFVADIDVPTIRPRPAGLIAGLLALFRPAPPATPDPQALAAARDAIQVWRERHPDTSVRLYRTAAGLRLFVTDRVYDPTGEDTAALLAELGADPLYARLTRHQQCFRARLTPKPWRCAWYALREQWPWRDDKDRRRAEDWVERYRKASDGYQVCEVLWSHGAAPTDPFTRATLALHDERCKVANGEPLA